MIAIETILQYTIYVVTGVLQGYFKLQLERKWMFRGGPAENVGKFGNMTIPYILPRLSDQSDRRDLSLTDRILACTLCRPHHLRQTVYW
jgi:hypothetical protein